MCEPTVLVYILLQMRTDVAHGSQANRPIIYVAHSLGG
jgi:hypothetical protein